MHLSDYMTRNKLTDDDVAEAIGRTRVSVSRYRRGLIRPSWDVIEAIRALTNNKVRFEDWKIAEVA